MELFNDAEFSPKTVRYNLSKSQYIKGMQCKKSLWFLKHRPELREQPDALRQFLFGEGHKIGKYAQNLFPGGVDISALAEDIPGRLQKTQEHLHKTETLFEATFQYKSVLVMVDILHKTPFGYELYEVKSSTTEKPVFLQDIALQIHVLEGCGLIISEAFVTLINSSYKRHGNIEIEHLFKHNPLYEKTAPLRQNLPEILDDLRTTIKHPNAPSIEIGPHCFHPYDCDFMAQCWSHIPKPSVFDISGLKLDKKFELYRKGIIKMTDIPEYSGLNVKQRHQLNAEKTNQVFLNKKAINTFLKMLHYPLYFLDFEAFQQAIPPYDGLSPFQQIAFQYSLHYLDSPTSELQHYDFIAEPHRDPRPLLAQELIKHIPENACIMAYNSSFEKLVFAQLASAFPDLAKELMKRHSHIIDLMVPFQRHDLYTKDMHGRFTIKTVLPALIPELSYSDLAIQDGQSAVRAYLKLLDISDETEKEVIKNNLKAYCKRDTFAMVKVLEVLKELAH